MCWYDLQLYEHMNQEYVSIWCPEIVLFTCRTLRNVCIQKYSDQSFVDGFVVVSQFCFELYLKKKLCFERKYYYRDLHDFTLLMG